MRKYDSNRSRELFLDVLYPKQCVCCGDIIADGEELCDSCIRAIERIDPLKRCNKCGLVKKSCQCKIYAYHFEGTIAPFWNRGIAQQGIYSFKFRRKAHYGMFFAREMAKTVKNEFRDIKFDAVCYVPSAAGSFFKRGFNQSRILAQGVSKILDIPLVDGSIKCKFGFGIQHKLGRYKRFKNVRHKYYYNRSVSGLLKDKTVLLVDDIKTTGATLDECSRQLLFSGASRVFCVTALITEPDLSSKPKEKQKGLFKNIK